MGRAVVREAAAAVLDDWRGVPGRAGPEAAPRLPVALFSAGFLAVSSLVLGREFGARGGLCFTGAGHVGGLACLQPGSGHGPAAGGYIFRLHAALRALDCARRKAATDVGGRHARAGSAGQRPCAARSRAAAVVGGAKRWRDATTPALVRVSGGGCAVVRPRNGAARAAFIEDFFVKHHLGRFATEALKHEQPFWFYLPVLLAGCFPGSQRRRSPSGRAGDVRRRVLLAVLVFGFVFFSASRNKLPGYLLPLVPAAAALIGISLAELRRPRWVLAACAATLGILPLIAAILPAALERGITHAPLAGAAWAAAIPALALAAAIAFTGRRDAAMAGIVAGMAVGVVWTASQAFPALDRTVSARAFWNEAASKRASTCVGQTHRSWRYNLNYYSGTPLPGCEDAARPFRIEQSTRQGARVVVN